MRGATTEGEHEQSEAGEDGALVLDNGNLVLLAGWGSSTSPRIEYRVVREAGSKAWWIESRSGNGRWEQEDRHIARELLRCSDHPVANWLIREHGIRPHSYFDYLFEASG